MKVFTLHNPRRDQKTLLDTENTRHRVTETNKEIENAVAVTTSDLFEGKSGFRRIIYLDVLFLAK